MQRQRYLEYETLPPYAVSEALAPRVAGLHLEQNLKDLQEQGYTVLRNAAPAASVDMVDRVREAIVGLAQQTEGAAKGYSAALLLGRDPVFSEAVLNPSVMAISEFMCGQGALVSQVIGSVRPKGAPALEVHADQNWTPAPFPEHNQLLTACWACEDFTKEGGATKVIPGSHRLKRHPTPEESKAAEGAIAVECPRGCIAIWDGSIWHGNWPRLLDGKRVVLHVTYSRLALRTVESYEHLGQDFLDENPPEMATLLGRTDFFGSTTAKSGGANMRIFRRTAAASKR